MGPPVRPQRDPLTEREIARIADFAQRDVCPTGPWADDIRQVAYIAASSAAPELARRRAKFAAIDEYRRLTHHCRTGGSHRWVTEEVSVGVDLDRPDERAAEPVLPTGALELLSDRERRIVCALADGATREEVAEAEGVTTSRLCQIVMRVRREKGEAIRRRLLGMT